MDRNFDIFYVFFVRSAMAVYFFVAHHHIFMDHKKR